MTGNILWLDLETTGLDPQRDQILEIGMVLTTIEGVELAVWRGVVQPTQPLVMSDYVRAMHERSGLLAELSGGCSLEVMQDVLCGDLICHDFRWLGGRNVGSFDLQFIKHHMPKLAKELPYRCIDISTLVPFAAACGHDLPDTGRNGEHRAMPDLRRDIAWYRTALALMRKGAPNKS